MFNLPPDVIAKLKAEKLLPMLEATSTNTCISLMTCPDGLESRIGAFHFVAILAWFEAHGVTDGQEMRKQLEEALKDAARNA